MLNDEASKPAGVGRLISDLRAAKVELLSAQCAADRLRLQSAGSLCRFFASIQDELKQAEPRD